MSNHNFQSWFTDKLEVGPMPSPALKEWHPGKYATIINVSDELYFGEMPIYERRRYWWFPLSEFKMEMGLNNIFAACVILWEAEQNNESVYLYCHSGRNRSWVVAAAYYYMRTGHHLERPTKSGNYVNKLVANCHRRYLPPQAEMEAWLKYIGKEIMDGMKVGILTMSKIETLKNF